MKRTTFDRDGQALIIVVFSMLIFAIMGAVVASMQSNYFETARAHLRTDQAFFLSDAGLERGKELLNDDPNGYKVPRSNPWQADPSDPTNTNKGWFRESISVAGVTGYYDVYADGTGGTSVTLSAIGSMSTE